MSSKVISLNPLPTDKEFEEYIAAFFQSDDCYIERSIRKVGETEVLEMDIIITNYNYIIPRQRICEIKSGGWGFPEIFKIKGWMQYLKFKKGLFIVQKSKPTQDYYKKISKELGISLVVLEDLTMPKKYFKRLIKSHKIVDTDIMNWRYSYWIERNFIKLLSSKKKSDTTKKCYEVLETYYFSVNSGVFFTTNIIDRLITLYNNYKFYPKLSAKVGHEISGDNFDDDHSTVPYELFKEAFYECEINDIQISTFVEHNAKLAILKNLVDYTLYKKAGDKVKTDDVMNFFGSLKVSRLDFLPQSFRNSLSELSAHKYLNRYPIFWQWFLWYFGGFILLDYIEDEYKLLSEKTGISVEEIPKALSVFDILFPITGGWFYTPTNSNVSVLHMFPIPFRGVGANVRRYYYTNDQKYESLKLTGRHTFNDLIAWNNSAVELLDKKFK